MNEPNAPADSNTPALPTTTRRTAWKWMLRFGLGLLVLGVLLAQRSIGAQVLATLRAVSPPVVLFAVGFYGLGQALCAWKWQRLVLARGVRVSLGDCCRYYAAGMFGNLWLPTNVGGDALRTSLLARQAPALGLAGAAASVLVERLTGFAALLALVVGGLTWRGLTPGDVTRGPSGWPMLISALAVALVSGIGWQWLGRVRHPKVASLRSALDFYWRSENRVTLWFALAVSLVFQASQVLLNIGLARATHLPLPDRVFWWLGPMLSLSGLIPVGVGGLGAREAAALALLQNSPYAVTNGQLVGWSLLWQATVWLASLPGLVWVRGNRASSAP